jgi:cupin 2 domain-containing protein
VKAGSLRDALPDEPQPEELVDILLESPGLRLERMVSTGQAMGEDNWFDQRWDEFVVVVSGSARLRIEGENEDRMLEAGDWILLPAHCRHRVTWTQSRPPTVWLAVHYEDTLNRREAEER